MTGLFSPCQQQHVPARPWWQLCLAGSPGGPFYGRSTVMHPGSSRHSSPTPQLPSSAADPLCFPRWNQSPFTAQCNRSITGAGSDVDGRCWDHSGRMRQAEFLLNPSLGDTVFPEASWEGRQRHPCKGMQQHLATAGKFKGREVSISSPRLSGFEVSSRSTAWELNASVHTPWAPSTPSHQHLHAKPGPCLPRPLFRFFWVQLKPRHRSVQVG